MLYNVWLLVHGVADSSVQHMPLCLLRKLYGNGGDKSARHLALATAA
jgi:hypothetical protein